MVYPLSAVFSFLVMVYFSFRFTHQFSGQPIPEILRIPLEPLLLRIEIMHKGEKVDFHKILGEPKKLSICYKVNIIK